LSSLWQRLPLAAKIALPYFLLTVVLALAGTYVATRLAARSANDRLTTALVEAVRAGDTELARLEEERLSALRELGPRPAAAPPPPARDRAGAGAALRPVPAGVDWAALVAADGSVLVRATREAVVDAPPSGATATVGSTAGSGAPAGRTDPEPADWAAVPAVGAALRGESDALGDRQAGLIADGQSALVAVAPLRVGAKVVGALVVGSDLAATARDLKRATLADAILYGPDGRVLASTLAPPPGGQLPPQPVPAAEDELRPAELSLGDRSLTLLVAPMRARGTTVGAFVAALPADAVWRVGADARTSLTLLFGGAMVLSLLLGIWIARTIVGPVLALVGAARALGAGDLTRRSGLRGRDEIGLLAQTFDAMAASLDQRQRDLAESYLRTVRALAAAVDAKDPYTHGHSQRVSAYATAAARYLGLDPSFVAEVEMGGLLHDVGKIGTPDGVLTKPGRLDDDEWAQIRKHPEAGAEILRPVGFGPVIMNVVLYHHERLNGRGFPRGLRGDQIPLEARIAAVCDAYDAMTSDRSYRRSLGREGAIGELRRGAGEQFDPACVEALIAVLPPDEPGMTPEPVGSTLRE
jgi:putative nucleotidyltransferase with HDIG domain